MMGLMLEEPSTCAETRRNLCTVQEPCTAICEILPGLDRSL